MKFQVNHDLHIHTCLSSCSQDPAINPESILKFGEEHGYDCLCLTDHYWDEHCGAAPTGFYSWQDTAWVKKSLPLPKSDKLRYCFGCETEFWGGERLGIAPETMDTFEFIIVPPNHLHLYCELGEMTEPEQAAELMIQRMEKLTKLDLPWKKIGIAHMTDSCTWPRHNVFEAIRRIDTDRLRESFRFFAEHGAGIELNRSCFSHTIWENFREESLMLYALARDAGCKFYCGSDAHHLPGLTEMQDFLPRAVEALELTEEQRYRIP